MPKNRRLTLVWNTEDIPQWHREARSAECLVRKIGRTNRVCPSRCTVAQSCPSKEMVPSQRSINVGGAAGNAESVPVLDWITQTCQRVKELLTIFEQPRQFDWVGLLCAKFSDGRTSENDLAIWFRLRAYPRTSVNFSVQRKYAGSVVGVCLHWDHVACGKRGSTPPTAGRTSSQPIEVESASSVGKPVAPVGPVRV